MKKLQQIEDKINRSLEKSSKQVKQSFLNILPKQLVAFYLIYSKKISQFIEVKIIKRLNELIQNIKVIIQQKNHDFIKKKDEWRIRSMEFFTYLRINSSSNILKNILLKIKESLNGIISKIENNTKKRYFFLSTLLIIIALTSGLNIISQSKKIYTNETQEEKREIKEKAERKIASINEAFSRRPSYYKTLRKRHSIHNVQLPVYMEDTASYKTLIIDFNILSSNRFTKKFLEHNELKVRDFLIMNLEPLLTEFALSNEEGKVLLKQAIKNEINDFILMSNVEGSISELGITYAIAN